MFTIDIVLVILKKVVTSVLSFFWQYKLVIILGVVILKSGIIGMTCFGEQI